MVIEVEKKRNGVVLRLNRPEKRNALNEEMVMRLVFLLKEIEDDKNVRYVVIRGNGKSFCAGADIEWMSQSAQNSKKENYTDAKLLASCFHAIYNYTKPTVAVVHGSAFGGGIGLLAACDIAICTDETVFSFSEVKLGIIPATISPFVLRRTGEYYAKEYMLTGRKFDGKEAQHIRLVNKCLPVEDLEIYRDQLTDEFNTAAPESVKACKRLINKVANIFSQEEMIEETSKIIAEIRTTDEAIEGFSSFLDKRKPYWQKE